MRKVQHNLLSRVPLDQIDRLYSKPEVFDQCRNWLIETGLITKAVPAASSSRAAEQAASEDRSAAIGSTLAAELYNLPIQLAHVEDNPNNTTRFFVLGRESPLPTGSDKTAIVFAVADRAGALVDVLDVFRNATINMSMILSRPSRQRNWEYYFFTILDSHASDPNCAQALEACRAQCVYLSVLGSFPRVDEAT
jgi:chorismate mutase/prephenate dehydratase